MPFFSILFPFYPGETVPRAETPKECVHAVTEASPSSAKHAQAGEQSEAEERQQYQFYMQGNLFLSRLGNLTT